MSESIVLEIDGNLYPLTSLLAVQDSSRISETEIADLIRRRLNNHVYNEYATDLALADKDNGYFFSDICPWNIAVTPENTPTGYIDNYVGQALGTYVRNETDHNLRLMIRPKAEAFAEATFASLAQQIYTEYANRFAAWLAAKEYLMRALRGEGVQPNIDGQQLMAALQQQCQQICDLIDSAIPPAEDPQ